MEAAVAFLLSYIAGVLLVLIKPVFKYFRSLRGVKVTYINNIGKSKTKIVYFTEDDPLYRKLKSRGEL